MSESNSKLIKAIHHYQQNLDRYSANNEESKMLHCIDRLQGLPIQVSHLEETGIGRTVNSLRKVNGSVGEAARALVNKWKSMVAQDEGEEDTSEKHVSSHNSDNNKEYNDSIRKEKQSKEERHHSKDRNHDRHHTKDRNDDRHRSKERHENRYHSKDKNDVRNPSNDVRHHSKEPHESRHHSKDRNEEKNHLKERNEDRQREKKSESSNSKKNERERKNSDKCSSRDLEKSSRKRKHETSSDSINLESNGSHKEKDKYNHGIKRKYEEENLYNKHQSSSDNCYDDSQSDIEIDSKKKSQSGSKKRSYSSKYKDSDDQSDHEIEIKKKVSDKSSEKDSKSKSHSEKHREGNKKHDKSNSRRREQKEMDSQSDQEVTVSHTESECRKHKDEKYNADKKKSHTDKYKDTDSQSDGDDVKKISHSVKQRDHSSDSRKHKSSKSLKFDEKSKCKKAEDEINEKKKSEKSTNSSSSSKSKSKNTNEPSSSDINKSSNLSNKSNSSSSKKKLKVSLDDGIDCGSGASFAEALGMLVPEKTTPSKSTKKVSNTSPEKKQPNPTKSFEPKLLSTSIDKLEPLDINITSLLPTISTNYKPIPMMNSDSKSKIYTDDEALTKLMYSKNQRTKVYSGNKTWIKMPSLFELCTRILQDNIDALEYTGGVPYAILKPVLEKASPEQLFTLEHHNPYIIDDSDELWNFHCQKEFRNKKREELETAREMYMRCLDEREAKLKALTANIKLSQDKSVPVRQTKLAYVDSVAKPPRNIAKKQFKNGTEKRPAMTPSSRLSAIATAGVDVVVPNHRRETSSGGSSGNTSMNKMKKAPLMAKTLQLMKGRFGRR